jgi:glycosyltransferase involved in cell wall biosynthesis
VVASRVGGVGEWLHDGLTGTMFESGEPGALAGALRAVLHDPGEAARRARVGRDLCRERFHPDRHVDDLLRLLESVA